MFTAVHHVAIIVSDYEKSRDFYVNKLGFDIIRENYRPNRGDYKLDLACGNIELELFGQRKKEIGYKEPPKRLSYPEAAGLRHLAFYVSDVEEIKKKLEEQGIEVEPVRYDDYTNKKLTFFYDPDGLPLELHE